MDITKQLAELARTGTITVAVRAKPGARKTELIEAMADGTWKIAVAAVPEDGAANLELQRFLAGLFTVNKTQVSILAGASARRKLVRIIRAA